MVQPPGVKTAEEIALRPLINEHLLNDLFLEIFSKLGIKDLLSASLVCKSWLDHAQKNRLWTLLTFRDFPSVSIDGENAKEVYRELYLNSSIAKGIYATRVLEITGSQGTECIIHSEDGKAYIGCSNGTIQIWDKEKNRLEKTLGQQQNHEVLCLALSEDGNFLFSGSSDGKINKWELATGNCVMTLTGHDGAVRKLKQKEGTLISHSDDLEIRIWDGNKSRSNKREATASNQDFVAKDEETALFSSYKTIHIWNLKTDKSVKTLEGHTGRIRAVIFSHDGKQCISSSEDKTVRVWTLETSKCEHTLMTQCYARIILSENGKWIIASDRKKTTEIWDLETGKCLQTIKDNDFPLTLAFTVDRQLILASNHTAMKMIKIFDFAAPKKIVFKELAGILRDKDRLKGGAAMDRFVRMPEKDIEQIAKLKEIPKEDNHSDFIAALEETAQAIDKFLQKES